ncbi:hypothetical protein [Desulfovulcanus sp.]
MALLSLLLLFAFIYAIWQSFHGILPRKNDGTIDNYNQTTISRENTFKYSKLMADTKNGIGLQKINSQQSKQRSKLNIQQLNQIDKLLDETSKLAAKNKKIFTNNYANEVLRRLKLILDCRNVVDAYLKHIDSVIARINVARYEKNRPARQKQIAIIGQAMNELKYRLQKNTANFYSLLLTMMRNIRNNKAIDKLTDQTNQAKKLFKQIRTLMASLNDLEAKSQQLFLTP